MTRFFFLAIIQCTGDKIRNPEYPSHPDQCICPGDTEEKKENGTECSCPYGSIADPDDSTICIGKSKKCYEEYYSRLLNKRAGTFINFWVLFQQAWTLFHRVYLPIFKKSQLLH